MPGLRPWIGTLAGAAATAVLAASCGKPLLSGASYDSPVFTVTGALTPFPVADLVAPRVGLVWVDPAGLRDDVASPAQDVRFQLGADGTYTLGVYAPPPAAAIRHFPEPGTSVLAASFGFAEIVLYEDLDGDGTFHLTSLDAGSEMVAPDLYRGASSYAVVAYVQQPLEPDAGVFPELTALISASPGYHLGAVSCTDPEQPSAGPIDPRPIQLVVGASPSPDLPYLRTCLRTHPSASSSSSSGPP
jgi:hypothetical protein